MLFFLCFAISIVLFDNFYALNGGVERERVDNSFANKGKRKQGHEIERGLFDALGYA